MRFQGLLNFKFMRNKIKNTSVEKWYNTSYTNLKLKKRSIEKIKADIRKNSRLFFSTMKKINEDILVEDTLNKVNTTITKPKSKKKKIFNACFLIVNLILVFFVFYNFATEQGGVHPLSELLDGHPKWKFLIIAITLYFVTVLFNTLKYFILIKQKTGKFRFWFSLKIASIGRYYDLVTPLGSGGQPFEIYYMKKNGYSSHTATAIPITKYMIWQLSFFLLCLGILIANSHEYLSSPLVLIFAWLGLSGVLLIFLFVFFVSITKRFGASIIVALLKLLFKLKIIKNYKLALVKVLKFVKSYQLTIKQFVKNPILILTEIIITMAGIISNSLIAFFIYLAFAESPDVSWWNIVCKCCVCELASCFVPLPGGSGAQELSFNALLGTLFPEGSLFWGVLFWRILTYYLYIAQGGIILIWDLLSGKKKHTKPKPKFKVQENPEI